MKVSFFSFSSRHPLFTLFVTFLAVGMMTTACDFNVELTDEKRVLEKIEGTPVCDKDNRRQTSKSGSLDFRLFLVDNRKEALNIIGITEPPFNLQASAFSVKDGTIKILDAETGEEVKGATATVKMGTEIDAQANPCYEELEESIQNLRIPKSVALLIDMSETAGNEDAPRTRTSATATWILDNFNEDQSRGGLDIFYTLLIRAGRLNAKDNLFKTWDVEKQYIAADGRKRGFLLTEEDTKTELSEEFTRLSPANIEGDPPMYEGIEASALDLRIVSRDKDTEEPQFNPSVVAISLERDVTIIESKGNTKRDAAQKALKGSQTSNGYYDFVPLQSIVYPTPDFSKDESKQQWDTHLDNLCTLAKAAGINKTKYWGNLFQVLPSIGRRYQDSVRSKLDMSYHAMKGYIQTKLSYTLGGSVEAGKRYIIVFSMDGELLGEQVKAESQLHFEVQL